MSHVKKLFYGIVFSDIIGVKFYTFETRRFQDNGVIVNKPHFPVPFVALTDFGKPIAKPLGVYFFHTDRGELVAKANAWVKESLVEIGAEVNRLHAKAKRMQYEMSCISQHEMARTGESEPTETKPAFQYTVYMTTGDDGQYCSIIEHGDKTVSHVSGQAEPECAAWYGLNEGLSRIPAGIKWSVLLCVEDTDTANALVRLAEQNITDANMLQLPDRLLRECCEKCHRLEIAIEEIDKSSQQYLRCQQAMKLWQ